MHLEDRLRQTIYEFPTLYRVVGNQRLSRLLALEHMMCSYGTEYEWHPDGYLADTEQWEPYGARTFPDLPEKFFTWDNLCAIETTVERSAALERDLQNGSEFWYARPETRVHERGRCYFVSGSREQITRLVQAHNDSENGFIRATRRLEELNAAYPEIDFPDPLLLIRAEVHRYNEGPHDIHPIEMCPYSPLVELLHGRTNSPLGENFDLDGRVQPDYLEGGREIARELLAYYANHSRYQYSFDYPGKPNGRLTMTEWESLVAAQTQLCREFLTKFPG
jgi:hypothetical protein